MSQRRSKRTTSAVHALWPIWAICGLLVFGMIAVYVSVSLSERPKASDIPVLDVP